MKTDIKLLELAAKAIGRKLYKPEHIEFPGSHIPMLGSHNGAEYWDPSTQPRDAFALAAKLKMRVYFDQGEVTCFYQAPGSHVGECIVSTHNCCETMEENIMLAITDCAATYGELM